MTDEAEEETTPTKDPLNEVEGWIRLEAGYFLGDCFVGMYEPDALEISHGDSRISADGPSVSFLPSHTACLPLPVLQAVLAPQGLIVVQKEDYEKGQELRELCEAFVEEFGITCAETVYQTDQVVENATEFIESLCDVVGYIDPEEDEKEATT